MIGVLLCRLGWHDPVPEGRWNGGYCFTNCHHCGRDMVRSAFGEWHVPKGFRVVWGPQGSVLDIDKVLTIGITRARAAAVPRAEEPPRLVEEPRVPEPPLLLESPPVEEPSPVVEPSPVLELRPVEELAPVVEPHPVAALPCAVEPPPRAAAAPIVIPRLPMDTAPVTRPCRVRAPIAIDGRSPFDFADFDQVDDGADDPFAAPLHFRRVPTP